MSTKTTKDIKI